MDGLWHIGSGSMPFQTGFLIWCGRFKPSRNLDVYVQQEGFTQKFQAFVERLRAKGTASAAFEADFWTHPLLTRWCLIQCDKTTSGYADVSHFLFCRNLPEMWKATPLVAPPQDCTLFWKHSKRYTRRALTVFKNTNNDFKTSWLTLVMTDPIPQFVAKRWE